jgi:hypothetical protein
VPSRLASSSSEMACARAPHHSHFAGATARPMRRRRSQRCHASASIASGAHTSRRAAAGARSSGSEHAEALGGFEAHVAGLRVARGRTSTLSPARVGEGLLVARFAPRRSRFVGGFVGAVRRAQCGQRSCPGKPGARGSLGASESLPEERRPRRARETSGQI